MIRHTRHPAFLVIIVILTACINTPQTTATRGFPTPTALEPRSTQHPPASTPSPTILTQPGITEPVQLTPALRMNTGHAAHTATLLPDGKVLIAGGFREEGTVEIAITSAEIYDPQANSFVLTGDMLEARSSHTATLLPNGKVLIVGGWGSTERLSSAELYDPHAGKFFKAASMAAPRAGMTATLLKNGTVLIAGGETASNAPQLSAEIYDPQTNTFRQAGSLNQGRSAHTATILNNGNVLLAGGNTNNGTVLDSAEIFEQATQEFIPTGDMTVVRYKHAAVLLRDGNVLVLGGSDENDWRGKYKSAEIYQTSTGIFKSTPGMNAERFKLADAVVLLNNGNVLIGGGNQQIEVYDAQDKRFTLSASLDRDYYFSVLTVLKDGSVLITGGYDASIQPSDQAWIYN